MTRRLTQATVGLAATGTTLLLLLAPPWLLTTLVGPPVPSSWPDLDTLRTIATIGVTDTFVVTTLAVIVWIAWAQLATAIVSETVAAIRHRPARTLPIVPGTQHLAARLVGATLLLATTLQPRPAAATAPLQLVPATGADTHDVADATYVPVSVEAASRTDQVSTDTVIVGERDSWWSLAETHLDDGRRWREIRDLNLDRTLPDATTIHPDTDRLEPGWPLLVPANDQTSPTGQPRKPDAAKPSARSPHWDVEPGDHFWHIARTTLEHTWDRAPTDDEIGPYWQTLIEANRDRLDPPTDPDLIHPGQRFELPPVPDAPQPTSAEAPEAARAEPEPTLDTHMQPAGRSHDTTSHRPDCGRIDRAADPATDEVPPTPQPGPTAPERDAAAVGPDADTAAAARADADTTPLGVGRGAAPAASAAALAAAGVVALLRRRRRTLLHQRLPGYRLPTLAPDVERHLATLQHVAPTDSALEDLTALLATIPPDLNPPLVIVHDHGPISLILDPDGDVAPVAPWQHDPGPPGEPPRWTAKIGDRGPCRSIGLPLLVTLGHTGTSTVLANLGALPVLKLQGPPDQVRARLRAMTLELATSRTAGPLEVTVCDDEQFTDLDQIIVGSDPSDPIAATLADAQAGFIDDDRLPRAVICHNPTGLQLPAKAARFCALLAPGDIGGDGWGLRLDGDQAWLHIPGDEGQPLALPDLDPSLIGQALDNFADDDALTATPVESPGLALQSIPTSAAAYCHVAVLGRVTVTRDRTPIEGLTPIARQLLTYLATHRDGVSLERLDATIWPDRPPSRGGQRARTALTRLRRSLGDGPDGQPLLPRRGHADELIRLSDHVDTDLDQAFALLANARRRDDPAQALDDRLAALALVRGAPFTDLVVSWSVDIEQRAIAQLQDTAVDVATALSHAGDHDRAAWAIQQGLLLCDPSEPLYVTWAHIEQARGRGDRIPQLWRRLCRLYADEADEIAGMATTPTTETELAFTQLMASA